MTLLPWVVLGCCALMCFGTNYIYDFPGVLGVGPEHTIQARFAAHGHGGGEQYTQGMNQGLYAAYSFPNTLLLVLGGVLIDQALGLRAATVLFSVIAIAGSVVFFVGVLIVNYPLLVLGRLLLGCGCECLGIAQSAWNTRWFKGKQGMALAFGIAQALQRSGSSLNFAVSPRIAESDGVVMAVLVGVAAVSSSLLAAGGLMALDNQGIRQGLVLPHPVSMPASDLDDEAAARRSRVSPCLAAVGTLLRTFRSFCGVFWLLAAACVCVYCSALPFVGIAKSFLEVEGHETQVRASTLVAIYQITSACGSPIVGAVADRTGRYVVWIGGAALTLCAAFVVFALHGMAASSSGAESAHGGVPPAALMAVMGGAFASFASTLWPSIPLSVPPQDVGKGLGLVTGLIALTTGVLRIGVGAVLDAHTPSSAAPSPPPAAELQVPFSPTTTPSPIAVGAAPQPTAAGFAILVWVFLGLAALAALWAIAAALFDAHAGTGVNASAAQRKALIADRAKGHVPAALLGAAKAAATAQAQRLLSPNNVSGPSLYTGDDDDSSAPISRTSTANFSMAAALSAAGGGLSARGASRGATASRGGVSPRYVQQHSTLNADVVAGVAGVGGDSDMAPILAPPPLRLPRRRAEDTTAASGKPPTQQPQAATAATPALNAAAAVADADSSSFFLSPPATRDHTAVPFVLEGGTDGRESAQHHRSPRR